MSTVQDVSDFLEGFAPRSLAEDWDNVGLLVGDAGRGVRRLMTCLTVTPASADEALREQAELIVTHHPLPFRALRRLTTETVPGRLLLKLIQGGVAVYSPHTAFDSAELGINQRLGEALGLAEIRPLVARVDDPDALGSGRFGRLATATSLSAVAARLRDFLGISGLQMVGAPDQTISWVAVACGSGGEFLAPAREAGCQLLVTGETNFHTCLEAQATGMGLLLAGHYASERFAVEQLAGLLTETFPDLTVWASRQEADPLTWIG